MAPSKYANGEILKIMLLPLLKKTLRGADAKTSLYYSENLGAILPLIKIVLHPPKKFKSALDEKNHEYASVFFLNYKLYEA